MKRFPQVEPWRKAIIVKVYEQEGVGKQGSSQRNGESASVGDV